MNGAIGIDLGATHIRAAIVLPDGELIGALRRVLPADPSTRRRAATDVAGELLARHPGHPVDAVGLAVAGTVDGGVLTWSANLGLDAVDFGAELRASTGRPTAVLNDARAAALAEARMGAGAGAATVLMVTVGTGIGGGLVIDGNVHTGTAHAGEIGHLVLDPDGPPCRCGHHGCWERLAGGVALDATAAELLPDGKSGAVALAAAASRGDTTALAAIQRHAREFARGLDSLCAVLAPHALVLGGGIIARPGPVRDAYLAATGTLRWHRGMIRTAVLGDDAGLLGAALAASNAS
ncbi:ROK family protein [Allokutzneria albata]|uniref:Glucokinase n=1 Tax=Allokutzneria albata TaxID=211114 RepID=A0A1G9SWS9_ALLAB|nr:ROK family protein [Allokutzneria albata]SDM39896.1 glucokinase [Allokutzneria albata]